MACSSTFPDVLHHMGYGPSQHALTYLPAYLRVVLSLLSYLLLLSQAAVAKENDEAVEALLLSGHSPHQVIT